MQNIQIHQLYFVRWSDGYYYPAVVEEVLLHDVRVAFLDGDSGQASKEHVVGLQEAFKTTELMYKIAANGFR